MKSFVATSNNQYLQDIVQKEGTYTYSALVKASAGEYAFGLFIGGSWQVFEAPTHTSEWFKLRHTFTTTGEATKFSLVANHATAGTPIEVLAPMFEVGSFASEARVNELDLLEEMANAEERAKQYTDALRNDFDDELQKFADDSLLSAYEKPEVKREWLQIAGEKSIMESQATSAGVAHTTYTDAYDALDAYLNNTTNGLLKDMALDTAINPTTYLNTFNAYYNAKIALGKAITDKLKADAANAQSAANSANSAISAMEINITALESKTDFISEVKVAGNTVAAGALVVGNASGANAGITGEGTAGSSTRFYAGSLYANRATANWRMRDDGVMEQWTTYNGQRVRVRAEGIIDGSYQEIKYNPIDGKIAKRTAIIDGYVIEEWYANGALVYQQGKDGMYYVSEIAESYYSTRLTLLNSSTSETFPEDNPTTFMSAVMSATCNSGGNKRISGANQAFVYRAGRNMDSESNKIYEGYKNTQSKTNSVSNGWYAEAQYHINGTSYTSSVLCMLLINGKIIKTTEITINANPSSFSNCTI